MIKRPAQELINDVDALAQFFARHLYSPVELSADASLTCYSLLIVVVDRLKEAAQIEIDLACLEAVARDLDVIDRPATRPPVGAGGWLPRLDPRPRSGHGSPPNQGTGGQRHANVVPFRRLPPRPLYVPAGPGGAA
ncbi:hypothetical protein [Ancylobacter defluvii]|uniref:Uncharacterized protein n=1 Tax=Ancylobacter defluvii TaxID=1282440 RepID=A0A9W6NCJ8_9HYPH|nr:hypothetical protein [Ancylobacter defluvii]MBS7586439.1 hypothetical protein [Ancylobacter defluvii]GLK85720.1 hypothetical protein GCM10017653_37900 [Ancylobacter defluvii]